MLWIELWHTISSYGNVDEADYKEKLGMVFKGITYPGTKVQIV